MGTLGWILLSGNLFAYVFTWRHLMRYWLYEGKGAGFSLVKSDELFVIGLFAALIASFWPFAWIYLIGVTHEHNIAGFLNVVVGETRGAKKKRKAELIQ